MVNRILFIVIMFIMMPLFITEAAIKLFVIMPVWWLINGDELGHQIYTGDFLVWCENKLLKK